jgi:hypothetical protein
MSDTPVVGYRCTNHRLGEPMRTPDACPGPKLDCNVVVLHDGPRFDYTLDVKYVWVFANDARSEWTEGKPEAWIKGMLKSFSKVLSGNKEWKLK